MPPLSGASANVSTGPGSALYPTCRRPKALKTNHSRKICPTPWRLSDNAPSMRKPVRFLKPHRIARLTAWALAMLAWIARFWFGADALNARRLNRRVRFLSLHRLTRLTCCLAIIRAVEITGIRARKRTIRNTARRGFRRRTASHVPTRACVGARLRKALRRGDFAERIRFLTIALSDIDAFTRRYLVPRALRGLTRLCAVVLFAPPAAAIPAQPAFAPICADSS
jgi:hypothetical protein